MTHQLIKHEQFFPVTDKDILTNVLTKAQDFLKESYNKYPDLEYIIAFQEGGVLVTGREVR